MTIILGGQGVIERPASLDRIPELNRTRKILMILLTIVLVSFVYALLCSIEGHCPE
jgi:hypothetical protein